MIQFIPHRVLVYEHNLQLAQEILGEGEQGEAK